MIGVLERKRFWEKEMGAGKDSERLGKEGSECSRICFDHLLR